MQGPVVGYIIASKVRNKKGDVILPLSINAEVDL